MRHERNYEAEFKNITYSDAKKIAKDSNIKEISVMQVFGKSEDLTPSSILTYKMNVLGFDENSIKNCHIELEEGRFPENDKEILLSSNTVHELKIQDKITLTLNGENKTYDVVGIMKEEPISKDRGFLSEIILDGVTYFDEKAIQDDDIVNVSIITNNIKDIYKTTEDLCQKLNLYKTEEEKQANLSYYDELLNYSLVEKLGQEEVSRE